MIDFFHSWAFAFIIGCFVGGAIGFIGAAILAASGRASRMEEKIEDRLVYEAVKREEQRRGDYLSSKQMVSDVEDILGRKIG
jgi:gas vesicle protein